MIINEEFTIKIESLMRGNISMFKAFCETLNKKGYIIFKQWLMNADELTDEMRVKALSYLNNSMVGRK